MTVTHRSHVKGAMVAPEVRGGSAARISAQRKKIISANFAKENHRKHRNVTLRLHRIVTDHVLNCA